MKKLFIALIVILLTGCNQYNDQKLLCSGDVDKEVAGEKSTQKNQNVILKIKDDNLRIGKNNQFIKQWVKVCEKGSHPLATKEQLYFNIKTCDAHNEAAKLIFEGTYNFSSKKLNVKQVEENVSLDGDFTCETSNLSQKDYKK